MHRRRSESAVECCATEPTGAATPDAKYHTIEANIGIASLPAASPLKQLAHHCFEMRDQQSGRKLDNAIEVHTVELTKYNLEAGTISQASKLEQWAFLLLRAQDYDAATLKQLLPGIEFETTIETIEIISEKTEDNQMYDQREKAQRDYEWPLSGAREEGERLGMKKGRSAGQVQLLQELLGDTPSSDKELQELGFDALADQLTVLQQRLRERQA